MRLGMMRDPRKICQDLNRVMPRSTGALAATRAPVDGSLGEGEFTARWPFESGGASGAGAHIGTLSEDRDTSSFADTDHPVGADRGQDVGPGRQHG